MALEPKQKTTSEILHKSPKYPTLQPQSEVVVDAPELSGSTTPLPTPSHPTAQHMQHQAIARLQRIQGNAATQHHIYQQRTATNNQEGARIAESLTLQREAENAAGAQPAPATESPPGTLWATNAEGKPLPPSLEDISQGGVGDCFLFAAMAAIVNTNPQKIVGMIRDNGNNTYTVTFEGIGTFSSATQTVSANFEVGRHGTVTARKALWPLIVEKAYAQQKGGLKELDKGGNPGDAVDDMLDDGPSRFDPREESADYIMGKLAKAKEKKWPMIILAPKKEGAGKEKKEMANNVPGLYFFHAYTIIDVDGANNRIKLFNPWGRNHPNNDGWMDVDQVRKFFIEVNIND